MCKDFNTRYKYINMSTLYITVCTLECSSNSVGLNVEIDFTSNAKWIQKSNHQKCQNAHSTRVWVDNRFWFSKNWEITNCSMVPHCFTIAYILPYTNEIYRYRREQTDTEQSLFVLLNSNFNYMTSKYWQRDRKTKRNVIPQHTNTEKMIKRPGKRNKSILYAF